MCRDWTVSPMWNLSALDLLFCFCDAIAPHDEPSGWGGSRRWQASEWFNCYFHSSHSSVCRLSHVSLTNIHPQISCVCTLCRWRKSRCTFLVTMQLSRCLAQVEMFLLGYALQCTIEVYRLYKADTEEFVTYYPDDHKDDWPSVCLVTEDDRHYNVPVVEAAELHKELDSSWSAAAEKSPAIQTKHASGSSRWIDLHQLKEQFDILGKMLVTFPALESDERTPLSCRASARDWLVGHVSSLWRPTHEI